MDAIVVTGVSSGIGFNAAETLCEAGYKVYGSVRKKEDGDKLCNLYPDLFKTIVFDVRDEQAIEKASEFVKNDLKDDDKLVGLVNNSGIALGGPFKYLNTDIFRKQLEVNVLGVVSVTRSFLNLLGAYKGSKHQGKIIMISSVSGHRAYPYMSPYSASKFALEGMSDSLRRELMMFGVDVILIEPGPVESEIWNKAPSKEDNPFVGTEYEESLKAFYDQVVEKGKRPLPTSVIGNAIKNIMQNPKPKTRYVYTKDKFKEFTIPGILPDRTLDKLMAKRLKLEKKD
jgi:NAD(P)-dependent dehydrogenase (short-subunit alcohol dehydrogenase family)